MALTPEQIQQYRQQFKIGQKEQPQSSTVGSLLGLANSALRSTAQGIENVSSYVTEPLNRAASAMNRGLEKVTGLDGIDQAGQKLIGNLGQKYQENVPQPVRDLVTVGSVAVPAIKTASPLLKTGLNATGTVAKDAMASTKAALPTSQGAAESIMNRIGRITPTKRNEFKAMTGQDVGEYLVSRGHVGNTEQTIASLAKDFQSSIKAVDDTLANAPDVRFTNPAVGAALKELEQKAAATSAVGAKSPIAERVAELKKMNQGAGLNLSETNEVKRLYERNVKLDYMKENLTDKVQRANNIDSAIRSHLFAKAKELGIEGLDEQNKVTQATKMLMDEIEKASNGRAANNAISITDWIVLGEVAADPAAISLYLGKKAATSEKLMGATAKVLAPKVKNQKLIKQKDPKPSFKDLDTKQQ